MSSSIPLSLGEQLYNRYCSNNQQPCPALGGLQVPDAGAGGSERGRFIKEFSIGALLRNSPGGVGRRRTCADCGTLVRIKEKYTELGELKDEYVCIMFAFFGTRRVCASFSSICVDSGTEGNDLGSRVYNAKFGA